MYPSDELACHDLVERVTDYLENALPPPERARLEAHLSRCPGCHGYLEQMRQTIAVLGRLHLDFIEPPMRNRLAQAFREGQRGVDP